MRCVVGALEAASKRGIDPLRLSRKPSRTVGYQQSQIEIDADNSCSQHLPNVTVQLERVSRSPQQALAILGATA